MPASGDETKHGPEYACEKTAPPEKHVQVFLDVFAAGFDMPECFVDRGQDENVHDGDGEQKEGGNQGSGNASDRFESLDFVPECRRRERNGDRAEPTIVEWPREKKNPAATGRLPSCISFRVTLSIAAI